MIGPTRAELERWLRAAGEEITDETGQVIGYVAQPARIKIEQPYLARGGFLVVEFDQESRTYIGVEYDALPHPKTGAPYPAGHSTEVWRVSTLAEALEQVWHYFAPQP